MSAYNIIKAVEQEWASRSYRGETKGYELEILLRCGRSVRCAPLKTDSYFLKVEERKDDLGLPIERVAYFPYEAIDRVVPIWL